MRLLYKTPVARCIALGTGLYILYYLYWRATSTLNPDAPLFSLVFLAAEVHGAVSFFLFAFMTWDVGRTAPFRLGAGLSVDIFVPTYDEELDILEPTLIGCRAITYPHTTYVLDDGRRPEVAALAKRLGCGYLTRPDNRHAKAGNLNAALEKTGGEFIVVLDADMVPQPDFLDKTLGYFVDERMALVQLPQEFYNLDSMQHLALHGTPDPWHDQSLFFRLIQLGKNRWNAAFWCGSPSVLRREALQDIGGVATETVTEDIHTCVRLHARGWKTIYHPESLAYGIAPSTLRAFSIQRLRWAQGSMQLVRSKDCPLTTPGLTLVQRLNYLASILTYFDSYQKLIFLIAPPIILVFGQLPLNVDGWDFVTKWVPYFGLATLSNIALGRGHFRYLEVELLNLLKLFTFIRASFTLLWPRPLAFKVTPKNAGQSAQQRDRSLIKPHLYVAGLTFGGIILALANLVWGITASYNHGDIVWITIFWSLVNGGSLSLNVWTVWRRKYQRGRYRFPTRVGGQLIDGAGGAWPVAVDDLSLAGAAVVASSDLHPASGDQVRLAVRVPKERLEIRAEVAHAGHDSAQRTKVGLKFGDLPVNVRESLLEYLFVTVARQQTQVNQEIAELTEGRVATLPPPMSKFGSQVILEGNAAQGDSFHS